MTMEEKMCLSMNTYIKEFMVKKPKIPGKSYQEPTCSDPHHLS